MNNPTIEKTVNIKRFSFDVSFFYGIDLARMWYEEFISNAGGDCPVERIGEDYYLIGDSDLPYFKRYKLKRLKKAELVEMAEDLFNYDYYSWDYSTMTKAQLIDDLMGVTCLDYYKAHVKNNYWRDRKYTFVARGHCQGDEVQVMLLDTAPTWVTCEHIENILYKVPLYCRVEVLDNKTGNNYELPLHEDIHDAYDYDKEDLLQILEDQLNTIDELKPFIDVIAQSVKEELPTYPDYL